MVGGQPQDRMLALTLTTVAAKLFAFRSSLFAQRLGVFRIESPRFHAVLEPCNFAAGGRVLLCCSMVTRAHLIAISWSKAFFAMARTVPLNPAFLRSTSLSFVFLWAGWLSFVYESKEIMRHEEGVG
ncbi:hypothetical protein AJ87_40315 [Rhizobium yanglingense]|nr:hypothetical protein AJ87_40315 [Rhizobium yanglingense]